MSGGRRESHREYRSVTYAGETIPFTLIFSRRKTYCISVEEDGEVILRMPLRTGEREISRVLTEKKDWIVRHYRSRKEQLANRPQSSLTRAQAEALEARCREAARAYFPKRAAYYQPMTGGTYQRISIRDQKTRWGSCSSRGTLSFNWRLMLAPPAVLDYVVVHELCHLTHMDHSPAFWQAVEAVLPDYRARRKWLKEHGSELRLERLGGSIGHLPGEEERRKEAWED